MLSPSVAATSAACVKSYRPRVCLQRHGHAGHAEQCPFERARHGPRIRHIVSQVVALVDARDDEIRQALEDLGDGDVDAVGRRAVHAVDSIADPLETQRASQRQRMADGARLLHRRDDGHVAETAESVRQRL